MKKVFIIALFTGLMLNLSAQTVQTNIVFDPVEGLYNLKRIQLAASGDTLAYQLLLPVWQDSTEFAATLFQAVTDANRSLKSLQEQVTTAYSHTWINTN